MSESTGFSAAEQAAIAERAQELRAQRGGRKKADALQDLLAKIEARTPHLVRHARLRARHGRARVPAGQQQVRRAVHNPRLTSGAEWSRHAA
ncbi:hypothetical protein, partial [Streptococcus pneumoniae]|uniref:hypothetical protein n=1 Tax=Streptococcus pneumoniae TaxID=1313 RepID=UPI0019D6AE8E